jgi:uncharacterized DUF497 family protein
MRITVEWDSDKARSNEVKHGGAFEEAATIFVDPLSLTIFDRLHSGEEDRFVTLGMSGRGRLLVVAHTDRAERICIISARVATRRERRDYEAGTGE